MARAAACQHCCGSYAAFLAKRLAVVLLASWCCGAWRCSRGAELGPGASRVLHEHLDLLASDQQSEISLSKLDSMLRAVPRTQTKSSSAAHPHVRDLEHSRAQELIALALQGAPQQGQQTASGDSSSNATSPLDVWLAELLDGAKNLRPAHGGFPFVRRVVVGALVRLVMSYDSPWPPETDQLVQAILVRFFELHRKAAVHKSAVEFLHVSKSGGSSLCRAAAATGCNVLPDDNCLVEGLDDGPRWARHEELEKRLEDTTGMPAWSLRERRTVADNRCPDRVHGVVDKGLNFLANEYTPIGGARSSTSGGVMCPEFLHVLLLRDPAERLRSHLRYMSILLFRKSRSNKEAFLQRFGSAADWRAAAPAAVDNYYVRSLLGEAAYGMAAGKLRRRHLRAAHLAMLQYDVLLVMEDSLRPEADARFRLGLGWNTTLAEHHSRETDSITGPKVEGWEELLPHDFGSLLSTNHYDKDLYEAARFAARLDDLVYAAARVSYEAAGLAARAAATGTGSAAPVAAVAASNSGSSSTDSSSSTASESSSSDDGDGSSSDGSSSSSSSRRLQEEASAAGLAALAAAQSSSLPHCGWVGLKRPRAWWAAKKYYRLAVARLHAAKADAVK